MEAIVVGGLVIAGIFVCVVVLTAMRNNAQSDRGPQIRTIQSTGVGHTPSAATHRTIRTVSGRDAAVRQAPATPRGLPAGFEALDGGVGRCGICLRALSDGPAIRHTARGCGQALHAECLQRRRNHCAGPCSARPSYG